MQGVLRDYCKKYGARLLELQQQMSRNNGCIDPTCNFHDFDFIYIPHAQHFKLILDIAPTLNYRVVHLIRNPLEIIMSGVRYHQVAKEEWCDKRLFVADQSGPCGFRRIAHNNAVIHEQNGQYSYQNIIRLLPLAKKVEFEIKNHRNTFNTIPAIMQFIKHFGDDKNVANIHLEEIASEECIEFVLRFLELQPDFKDAYRRKVSTKSWLGRHVTNAKGGVTHRDAFSDELHAIFAAEFGSGLESRFGYGPDSDEPSRYRAMLAAIGDTRPCELPDDDLELANAGDNRGALYSLGEASLSRGRLKLAAMAFRAVVTQDATSIGALGRLGHICMLQADHLGAIDHFRRVLALAKTPPSWAYISLANAFTALDNKSEAIESLRLAIPLMEDATEVKSRLALLENGKTLQ
jgi:tetratricopeptide (TPR) repeat protein